MPGNDRTSILVTPTTNGAVFNKSLNASRKKVKSFKGLARVLSNNRINPMLPLLKISHIKLNRSCPGVPYK